MSVVARILVMFLAYVLACVGASAVFTIGMLTPDWAELASSGLPSVAILAIVAIGAPIIGVVAALPAALVVAIAEGFAWRSVLFYAALGGALALALSYGVDLNWGGEVSQPASYFAHERQVLAAAGIAGGLVYWLFAGRSAGSWK
jgi:hypothetical protein